MNYDQTQDRRTDRRSAIRVRPPMEGGGAPNKCITRNHNSSVFLSVLTVHSLYRHQLRGTIRGSYSAYMPLVWLTAYISPIYKKGDSSEACNYRPISLTCTLCKIMEVTVKDHVMKCLLSYQ